MLKLSLKYILKLKKVISVCKYVVFTATRRNHITHVFSLHVALLKRILNFFFGKYLWHFYDLR